MKSKTKMGVNLPPGAKRRAVLLMDSGSEADKELIDTFRQYVSKEMADIIVVSTVPPDWDGALENMANPAYPNIYNPWLFDSKNIDHLVLVEENETGLGPSIATVANAIRELDVEVRGILPNPLQAWNEIGIARLAHELGIRHAPVASVEACLDKTKFTSLLREMQKEHQSRDDHALDDLFIPRERVCRTGSTEQRIEQIGEAVDRLLFPANSAKKDISAILDRDGLDKEQAQQDIFSVIDELDASRGRSAASGKVIIKPTDKNGGSIGVVMITDEDDAQTVGEKINRHIDGQKTLGSTESSVQEFVEGIEVGYHGIKHGDEIVHELTMKTMTEPPYFKELEHYIPRAGNDLKSKGEWELYQDCCEKVFPVMEALFKKLDIDVSHLNTDIKITKDGQICILDAQLRTGLGVPKMLGAVYDAPDFAAQRMFMGMDLFSERETDSWLSAKHASQAMNAATPVNAAIVATQFPEESFVKAKITDASLYLAGKIKEVFHLAIPETFEKNKRIPALTGYMSIKGRPQIGTKGKTLESARRSLDQVKKALEFRVLPVANEESSEYERFVDLLEKGILGIGNSEGFGITILEYDQLVESDLDIIKRAMNEKWYLPSYAPSMTKANSAFSSYVPEKYSSTQRTFPRWDGKNSPPCTVVHHTQRDNALSDNECWHSSRPPTLRENLWQSIVRDSEYIGKQGKSL